LPLRQFTISTALIRFEKRTFLFPTSHPSFSAELTWSNSFPGGALLPQLRLTLMSNVNFSLSSLAGPCAFLISCHLTARGMTLFVVLTTLWRSRIIFSGTPFFRRDTSALSSVTPHGHIFPYDAFLPPKSSVFTEALCPSSPSEPVFPDAYIGSHSACLLFPIQNLNGFPILTRKFRPFSSSSLFF